MTFLPILRSHVNRQNSLEPEQPKSSSKVEPEQSSSEASNECYVTEGHLNPQMVLADLIRQQQIKSAYAVKAESATFNAPHSFAKPAHASVTHLEIDHKFDLKTEKLYGVVTVAFTNFSGAKWLYLDTGGLIINEVVDESRNHLEYFLGTKNALLAQELTIRIPKKKEQGTLEIYYSNIQDAEAGLPSNSPEIKPELITFVDQICENWLHNNNIEYLQNNTQQFTPQQWIYFFQNLKKKTLSQKEKCSSILAQLDRNFEFSKDPNLTIRDEWLITAVELEYTSCYLDVQFYVLNACKPEIIIKFLCQLVKTPEGLVVAREIHGACKSGCYARSRATIEAIMQHF